MREQVVETDLLVENRGRRLEDEESGGITGVDEGYYHLLINEPEPKSSQTKLYSNITEKQCPLEERTKRKVTCFIQRLLKWLLL